jgi:L-iditol 2-dehydrogenase
MKAVVVRAPMDFGVETVPDPEIPEQGLLLQVQACGLCGSDLRTLRHGHPRVHFPWVIGHEPCGTVMATGPGYRGPYRPGDRLAVGTLAYCGACAYCQEGRYELCSGALQIGQAWPGGLAEYLAIPEPFARLGNLQRVPDDFEAGLAGLAEPLAACLNAQEKGRVGLGDVVLVIGAGPVGCIHVRLAQARGAARILMAEQVDERVRMAEMFAPQAVIHTGREDLYAAVQRLTGGKGADVVITATPSPAAVGQALNLARRGGRILIFGGLPGGESHQALDINAIHYGALEVIGTTVFAPRHFRLAIDMIISDRLGLGSLITHRFPLDDFCAGAGLALQGKVLKSVFYPDRSA